MVINTNCKCGTADENRKEVLNGQVLCAECALEEAARLVAQGTANDSKWHEAMEILSWVPKMLEAERRGRQLEAEQSRERINREMERQQRLDSMAMVLRKIAGAT